MKKIALISDTHGYLGEEIHKYLRDADEVWHAGDVGSVEVVEELEKNYALRAVFGNIDNHEIRAMIPEHNYFELEGVKVLITHIAGRPGKYYRQGAEALENKSPLASIPVYLSTAVIVVFGVLPFLLDDFIANII